MNAPITNNATIIPTGFSSGIVGFSWPDVLQNAGFDVLLYCFKRNTSGSCDKVAAAPERGIVPINILFDLFRKSLAHLSGQLSLDASYKDGYIGIWWQ